MSVKFEQQLFAEVVKSIESHGPLRGSDVIEKQLANTDQPLETKILKRAASLVRDCRLGPRIQAVRQQSSWITAVLIMIFVVLGALAAQQAFDQVHAGIVNFYWLILVLLGFHLLALVLWTFAVLNSYKQRQTLNSIGTLVQYWAGRLLAKRSQRRQSTPDGFSDHLADADSGERAESMAGHRVKTRPRSSRKVHDYSATDISFSVYQSLWRGDLGRWSGSKLSHGLWLGYLSGGCLMILLMLSTRQYDFVWETTILSAPSFISVTEFLSWLPAMVGFPVPESSQIAASRFGVSSIADSVDLRQAWAGLLIGCIILYGLLPRVLLLLLSHLFYRRACRRFTLDLTDPYYVALRNRLMPATRQFGIVDPDLKGKPPQKSIGHIKTDILLPPDAIYLGIELNADQPWPPQGVARDADLGCVDDGQGQQRVLAEIKAYKSLPLVAVVPVQRSPDRGQSRFLESLKTSCHGEFYLGLSEAADAGPGQLSRQSDWYQLALGIGIPADHIVRLSYTPLAASSLNSGLDHRSDNSPGDEIHA